MAGKIIKPLTGTDGGNSTSAQQQVLGGVDARSKKIRPAAIGVHPLHKAPVSLADLLFRGPRLKTKHLVGLLLGHGARSRRASLPRVVVRMRVVTPAGRPAVKVSFK